MFPIIAVVCCVVAPLVAVAAVGLLSVLSEYQERAVNARWAAVRERVRISVRG